MSARVCRDAFIAAVEEAAAALAGDASGPELLDAVEDVIGRIVADPADAVTRVWHPLGCLYVELLRSRSRSIRLHVWGLPPRRGMPAASSPHAHDFDLLSAVLTGALDHTVYDLSAGAPTHQVLDVVYRGDTNLLRPTGRPLRCVPAEVRRVEAGSRYGIDAGRVHRVRAAGPSLTATFVVAALRRHRRNLVLGPLHARDPIPTAREPCETGELRAVLRRVLARLREPAGGGRAVPA